MTTTRIATSDATSITVLGADLVENLIGKISFTAMTYLLTTGRHAEPAQVRLLDACLVTLAEHGFTPGAIASRLVADAVPGEMQSAVAAGLLTVGGVYAGTMEGCAKLLVAAADAEDAQGHIREVVASHVAERRPLHGFGHANHKPDDPRTPRLLALAKEEGHAGRYIDLLLEFDRELDRQSGRHITINATGAIAAILLEIGIHADVARGIALVSRSAGLVGHVLEEARTHSARSIIKAAKSAVPYSPE